MKSLSEFQVNSVETRTKGSAGISHAASLHESPCINLQSKMHQAEIFAENTRSSEIPFEKISAMLRKPFRIVLRMRCKIPIW